MKFKLLLLSSFFIVFISTLECQCFWHDIPFIQEKNSDTIFSNIATVLLISIVNEHSSEYFPIYKKNKKDTTTKVSVTSNFREYISNRKSSNQFLKIWHMRFKGKKEEKVYAIEEKKLDNNNVDSLKRIIKYYYRLKVHEPELPKCYEPKNAILLLDKKNRLIAYIELCFSCIGWRILSDNKISDYISFENLYCWCNSEMSDFFKRNGIKYGVVDSGL
jgi:hypothetical protein